MWMLSWRRKAEWAFDCRKKKMQNAGMLRLEEKWPETHCSAVGIHVAQLWDRILGIDGNDDLRPSLVPVEATRDHLLTLRSILIRDHSAIQHPRDATRWSRRWVSFMQTCAHTHIQMIACWHAGTPTASFFLHRCVPLVQPSWERKALKSEVFLLQQLQYFILEIQERFFFKAVNNLSLKRNCKQD